MSAAWGSAYCWPLVGTSASCFSSHDVELPDETNTSAADEAEKTDAENEMEKYTTHFLNYVAHNGGFGDN